MALFFMRRGEIISNLIYAGLMGLLLYSTIRRLTKEQKRTQAKVVDTTNEKYIFRIWLLALGMGGEEF